MVVMTPKLSAVLEKALTLSLEERGLLIDRLVESLDGGPPEEGVEHLTLSISGQHCSETDSSSFSQLLKSL